MFRRDTRWKRALQYFPNRRNVIIRNPAAKLENLWTEQRTGINQALHCLHFHTVWSLVAQRSDESLLLPFPKGSDHTTPNSDSGFEFVDKSSRQRQAHRDIDVHRSLRAEPEKFGANLLHVFPD